MTRGGHTRVSQNVIVIPLRVASIDGRRSIKHGMRYNTVPSELRGSTAGKRCLVMPGSPPSGKCSAICCSCLRSRVTIGLSFTYVSERNRSSRRGKRAGQAIKRDTNGCVDKIEQTQHKSRMAQTVAQDETREAGTLSERSRSSIVEAGAIASRESSCKRRTTASGRCPDIFDFETEIVKCPGPGENVRTSRFESC